MAQVEGFDNVKVLQVGVTGAEQANRLFIVTGVAIIDFRPAQQPGNDYTREELSFHVPDQSGNPLSVGFVVDAAAIAFPATIESTGSEAFGFGVDNAFAIPDGGDKVTLFARVVAKIGPNTNLIRVGFQVSILASV